MFSKVRCKKSRLFPKLITNSFVIVLLFLAAGCYAGNDSYIYDRVSNENFGVAPKNVVRVKPNMPRYQQNSGPSHSYSPMQNDSKRYVNPYYHAPEQYYHNPYYYYDNEKYYVPPTYYNNIEPPQSIFENSNRAITNQMTQ
jgi:hypothetical protein